MTDRMFTNDEGKEFTFSEILRDTIDQPQCIGGERGQHVVTLRDIEICECFVRGMLDAATDYSGKSEMLNWGHLCDIIYKVQWRKDFDPIAIVQYASCHMEKVLGIFPNGPELTENERPIEIKDDKP